MLHSFTSSCTHTHALTLISEYFRLLTGRVADEPGLVKAMEGGVTRKEGPMVAKAGGQVDTELRRPSERVLGLKP